MVQSEDVPGMPGRSSGCEARQLSLLGGRERMQGSGRSKVMGGFCEGSLLKAAGGDPDTATLWAAPGWLPLTSHRSFFEASRAQPKDPSAWPWWLLLLAAEVLQAP